MCNKCGYKFGSTKHLLYWLKWFIIDKDFKKANKTLYHLVNRKAYRKWFNKKHQVKALQLGLLLCETDGYTEAPDDYAEWLAEKDPLDLYNYYYEDLK